VTIWPVVKLCHPRLDPMNNFMESVKIVSIPGRGRGLVASRNIMPGEIFLEEPALICTALRYPHRTVLCSHCLACVSLPPGLEHPRNLVPENELSIPKFPVKCPEGCGMIFCGDECAENARPAHFWICGSGSSDMLKLQVINTQLVLLKPVIENIHE
jgi:hypothetical protein